MVSRNALPRPNTEPDRDSPHGPPIDVISYPDRRSRGRPERQRGSAAGESARHLLASINNERLHGAGVVETVWAELCVAVAAAMKEDTSMCTEIAR